MVRFNPSEPNQQKLMADEEHHRNWRLRFSLRTLMLLTTFVAMVVSLLVSTGTNRRLARSNESLAKENRRLRDEVGELSIEDESQFHATRIPTDSALEWTWRVWIPEGQRYRLRCVAGKVPKEGWPSGRGATITLGTAGEHVIRYSIRRDPKDDRFCGWLSTRGASGGGGSVGWGDEHAWVQRPPKVCTTGGVGTSTRAYPMDRLIELCRHRVSQANSSEDIEDPSEGFLIWLERVK